MLTSDATGQQPVFEYRTLRLLVGSLTFLLPALMLIFSSFTPLTSISVSYHTNARNIFVGSLFMIGALLVAYQGHGIFSSFTPLTSISVSYHTNARNIFVGSLFMIGALLVAYQGHGRLENWLANLGAVAAIVAALCPTSCELCCDYCAKAESVAKLTATIHLLAGATLFLVIAYFCLGPFIQRAKEKPNDKAKRRIKVYTVCGWVIIACILIAGIAQVPAAHDIKIAWLLVFWAELFALWAFGIAWIVASRFLTWTADEDEKLHLSLNLG
ncbi:MAG: hypothetical protein HZC38_16275 [Chloroflexi bacterium]|nr:hypothetical protein [Chloroflexota bacterium]